MFRILAALIALLAAAGVAYVWVVPHALDDIGAELGVELGVEPVEDASQRQGKDTSRITSPTTKNAAKAADSKTTPAVGAVDPAKLAFEVGCGLQLARKDEQEIVFVNAAEGSDGQPAAAIVLDGKLVALERTTADGDPLEYGQYPRQIFDSQDQRVRVVVEIEFGAPTGTEELPVSDGHLVVMETGRPTLKFEVAGAAGC
jgi:hypothetical protein